MKALKAAFVLAAVTASGPALAASFFSTVIASGLNNPRGLAFGPDNALYIAESGLAVAGGPSVVIRGNVFSYADTGSITRVFGGVQSRIVTGLPSIGSLTIAETTGPQDIVFGADGTGYVVVGLGTSPALRSGPLAPGGSNLGQIYSFTNAGVASAFSDVAAFESANNPTGGPVDSNPFRAAALSDGLLATDAGGNSLLKVANAGGVSLVAALPGRFMGPPAPLSETVPTGVAVGPDGNYYVAELTGFPFVQDAARIYQITPGGMVNVFATGFTMLTDIAFGADGTLYALELDDNGALAPRGSGALIKIGPGGTQEVLFSGLAAPTGLEIGRDGSFYVTNFSNSEGMGQVLRIAAVPEPQTWAFMIAGFGLVGGMFRQQRRLRMQMA